MTDQGDYVKLAPESDTLLHLPDTHRTGLIAVGTAALISFISTTTLFLFLTYKLLVGFVARHFRPRQPQVATDESTLGLSDRPYSSRATASLQLEGDFATSLPEMNSKEEARNPFPLLIYNLLFAEMQTSLGYTLNIEWVVHDGIYVGSSTCWAQGWLNNVGILASSIFLVSVSINTYLSVVRGFRPPQWFIRAWVAFCWTLTLVLTSAGIVQTNNGRAEGGWFVRANTWCWVNAKYASARLWGEWAWILVSIPVTIILYSLVFWSLYRENRSSRHLPQRHSSSHKNNLPSGYHPAFLIYPFIYIACTSPLAIARLITISGGSPGVTYYCIAGLILATNGFWNTILWLTTMLISTPEDIRNTGLEQFAFIRTPSSRRYGNMVWINGPASKCNTSSSTGDGWWWWKSGGETRRKGAHSRNTSQQSLRREMNPPASNNCIHMDVITAVVVEENTDTMTDTIYSTSISTNGKKTEEYMSDVSMARS